MVPNAAARLPRIPSTRSLESLWQWLAVNHGEQPVRPGQRRVQDTLAANVLRKVGRLDYYDAVELKTSGSPWGNDPQSSFSVLPD